ncbi:MAG: hypothetical protein E6G98_00750 [Bacillati bacterium ANGP1]|uniref:Oxidoreductase molybdopterin-binding domain-containing protein n=1 Tax=Candidatus Segetimicrobium genomatis TaxID=2569760 RepID=A0A537LZ06_9BACT|nr:MAG: hypothetical protein E6G98_00750 [Terrabacteria group bacterium ANGP1]
MAAASGNGTATTITPIRGRRNATPLPGSSAGVSSRPRHHGPELTRRELLRRSAVLAAGALAGPALAQWVRGTRQNLAAAQGVEVRGLPAEVTPTGEFYIVSKNPPGFDPDLDASLWRLEVAGRTQPLRLSYRELLALPSMERSHTLECISNEVGGNLISNAKWRGVPLRMILEMAGADTTVRKVAFRCADGYTTAIPMSDALHPDTLLAYEMNGERLPSKHGFPARLLVGGLYGMKNPKWITRIEPADHFLGYWEQRGWSQEAVVKTMSKFTTPNSGATLPAGRPAQLGGVAYAGNRGIRAVECSIDDGRSWLPAAIKSVPGPDTWVLWAMDWTPPGPGSYLLRVRAADGTGQWQTADEAPTLPDGASGLHRVRVYTRA